MLSDAQPSSAAFTVLAQLLGTMFEETEMGATLSRNGWRKNS